jgi:hypothetical protein
VRLEVVVMAIMLPLSVHATGDTLTVGGPHVSYVSRASPTRRDGGEA